MSSRLGVIALVLSVAAVSVAAYALSRVPPDDSDLRARVDALDEALGRLAREVEARDRSTPSLRGSDAPRSADVAATRPMRAEAPAGVPGGDGREATRGGASEEAIETLVEEAVDRKVRETADEMQLKANKRPPIDAFARALELTPEQVRAVEENVRRAQLEVHALLNTPTADGHVFLDELVDVVAKGMANPGQDAGWGAFIGRVLTERFPGTDDSYGVRIEAAKQRLRDTFKRDWTPEQYAEFEAWGIDPTEIQGVPGSPNEALLERIRERARQLGARLPDD